MTCPECDRVFHKTEKVKRPGDGVSEDNDNDFNPSRSSSTNPNSRERGKGKEKRRDYGSKGKDSLGFEPFADDGTWISKSDVDPGFPLSPSSKTTALKALLLKGFEDAPLDKVCLPPNPEICLSRSWNHLIRVFGDC